MCAYLKETEGIRMENISRKEQGYLTEIVIREILYLDNIYCYSVRIF